MGKLIKIDENNIINLDEISNISFNNIGYWGSDDIDEYIEFLKYKEFENYGFVKTDFNEFIKKLEDETIRIIPYTIEQFAEYIKCKTDNEYQCTKYIYRIEMEIVLKNGYKYIVTYYDSDKGFCYANKIGDTIYVSKDKLKRENESYIRIKELIMENVL